MQKADYFTGVGKTSLIKSIVQLCEDIVHVDPVLSSSTLGYHRDPHGALETVNEVYASTKPYPAWWSNVEESRILRRRKSMGDSVLERNICFVETSDSARLEKIIHYTEQQLMNAMTCVDQLTNEFSGLLSGRGSSQVDVILYLISKGKFGRPSTQLWLISTQNMSTMSVNASKGSPSCAALSRS